MTTIPHNSTHHYLDRFKNDVAKLYFLDKNTANTTYSPQQRGAYITIAKKKARTHLLILILDELALKTGWDVTPTFALRLINGWVGHGVDQRILRNNYGTPKRTAAEITQSFDNIDVYIAQFQAYVNQELEGLARDLTVILTTIQMQYLHMLRYSDSDPG
jgi:hypothetical protein